MTVNIKNKKILSIMVTDEHVHDSKVLPKLVENITKSDSKQITISKIFVKDGTYDGNDILGVSQAMDMLCIKVRKNAQFKLKTDTIIRNLSVISGINICKNGKR